MITSASNAQIKRIIALNSKAKARREEGCFAVEGIKLFRETPEKLRQQVLVSESFSVSHRELLAGIPFEVVEDKLFLKMCDTQTPQGIITVARFPEYSREDLLGNTESGQPMLLILEDLQDPGNVGTILRTAEGAGVTGIFMSGKTADPFQPKTTRSTMGSIFRVPFRRENDLQEVCTWLKSRNVCLYAAHLKGTNAFTGENYRGGTAFMIGNEGNGLSDELSGQAERLIRIPMEGQVESLNAGVAAALLMYTAHTQRHS